ncbi:MAG: LysR family transcriptional regulator [Clostridia bacterium]|jgi:DNA-binding transcriptional LysR family regulator|nr:LysR family transcriptional regulator [Clostridia bacterium]
MELRVLKYFLAVAREQNITAAAESLHVTQPTLSKQLIDLEGELGSKLFERGKRKITLTEEGVFLRQRAQEIVDLADKTEAAFTASQETVTGDVYIGCGETQGMRSIIKIMKIMQEAHPDVRFHLYSGNDEDVSERLETGLVDFGLFVGSARLDKYDYIKLPVCDAWGLLMRKDDPLAARETIRPKDLERVPLLCSRQALSHNELSGWLGKDFTKLRIRSTHNLLFNASLMVEEGLGCALAIEGLINTAERNLVFRPFEPTVRAELIFARKKYRVLSKAAELFLQYLQKFM